VTPAAVGLGLAGLAAAGAVLLSASATSAAPEFGERAAARGCNPGSHTGRAVRKSYRLKVRGKSVADGFVGRGDWVRTDSDGAATLCIAYGSTTCELGRDTVLQVRPPANEAVLLYVTRAESPLSCETSAGGDKDVDTPGTKVRVDDPIFSVTVGPARTLVKVPRGAAVVGRRSDLSRAVVLGRKQQVAVPSGRDPEKPVPIKVTPAEQATFKALEKSAPPDTDKTPPSTILAGPRPTSSLRSAAFTFTAADATFSCALDGSDLRLCASPQQFQRLRPGGHVFTVRAVDGAGNARLSTHPWTIDGSLIAFTSDRDGNLELYTIDPDGVEPRRLTDNGAADADPAWSPDGRRIAFHSERDGNSEIYVINADGTGAARLTTNPATDRNPAWSPDGKQIVFESYRDGNRELYAMNADGSGQARLTRNDAEDYDPDWSRNGRIAFASGRDGNAEIYVMNPDGSGVARLTTDPAVEFNPAWSPDGSRIAFHSQRSKVSMNIYVMNADGSGVTRLTETAYDDYNPAWSPDGAEITFQSTRDSHPAMEIYRMHADGSDETRLTMQAGNDFVPDW
jgi:Tol biopolymer transport system component